MKKLLFLVLAFIFALSGLAYAGEKLYVHSTEVLRITSTTGISTFVAVPAAAEKVMIGVSGNSIYWLAGGMNGRGNDGRGIVLDSTVFQPLVIEGRDVIKSLQFGTCSLSATTVYGIYLYKP